MFDHATAAEIHVTAGRLARLDASAVDGKQLGDLVVAVEYLRNTVEALSAALLAQPAAIRRAVTLRDRGCAFPGCDRPPSWSDVHHCQPWDDGGHTNVDNRGLLYRRHHTFVHANGWRIVIPRPRGRPETHRPDGTPYRIERWPRSEPPDL